MDIRQNSKGGFWRLEQKRLSTGQVEVSNIDKQAIPIIVSVLQEELVEDLILPHIEISYPIKGWAVNEFLL